MQVAIETLYEHTDRNGDTLRIEQIKGVEALIITLQPKGSEGGSSTAIPFLEALSVSAVLRTWTNAKAKEMIKNAQ